MESNKVELQKITFNYIKQKESNKYFIWLAVFLLISITYVIILCVEPLGSAISIRTFCLCNFIVFLLCYLFNQLVLKLNILSLPQIYILITFLYTSGVLTLHGFGLAELDLTLRWYDESYAILGIKMIMMAVFAMEAGICLALLHKYEKIGLVDNSVADRFAGNLFRLGCWCFSFAILIIYGSTFLGGGLSSMFSGGYEGFTETIQGSDVRLFLTALSLLMPVSIILMAAGSLNIRQRKAVYLCGFIGVVTFFLVGDRGGAFTLLIALAFTLNLVGRKINYKVIMLGAILVLILIPIIRDLRHQSLLEIITSGAQFDLEESLFVRALSETGSSFQTFLGSLMIVPDLEDYRYGTTYIHALSNIFPNLGTWSPPSGEIVGLNAWITSHMNPFGSGLAFLQIAEFYVQFGVAGIYIGFLAIGYFLTKWQKKCESGLSDRRLIAISGCTLCFLLIWVRNDIFNFIRPVTWSTILVFGYTYICKYFTKEHYSV